jgi:hypothetical protein
MLITYDACILTAVLLTVPLPTFAQRAKVGVVDAVEGGGTVTRETAESRSLGSNEEVLVQDRIMTDDGGDSIRD